MTPPLTQQGRDKRRLASPRSSLEPPGDSGAGGGAGGGAQGATELGGLADHAPRRVRRAVAVARGLMSSQRYGGRFVSLRGEKTGSSR